MDRPRRVREAGQRSPWKLVCIIQEVNLKLNSKCSLYRRCSYERLSTVQKVAKSNHKSFGPSNVPRWQPNKGASQVEALMWRGGSFTCVSGCAAIQDLSSRKRCFLFDSGTGQPTGGSGSCRPKVEDILVFGAGVEQYYYRTV
jgi:hypothetical protein